MISEVVDPDLADIEPLNAKSNFRPDVEGLRAIAVGIVVLYHFHLGPFRGGYVGVDVFFVLSGFVITQMMLRESEQTSGFSWLAFYARRIRRILPAATMVLCITIAATFVFLGSITGRGVSADARAAALFFSNIHSAHSSANYFTQLSNASPLVHFWSLSIEEQFYFVWPLLFFVLMNAFIGRRRRVALGIAVGSVFVSSVIFSVVITPGNPQQAFYSSFARTSELALGALVAIGTPLLSKIPHRVAHAVSCVGLAMILVAATTYTDSTTFPGFAVLLPILGTAFVVVAGTNGPVITHRILGVPPMLWLGALSYSLYLWHWPIFAITQDDLGHRPSIFLRVLLLFLATMIALVSLRMIENPIRRSKTLSRRRGLTFLMGGLLILSTLGVSYVASALAPPERSSRPVPPAAAITQLHAELEASVRTSALPTLVVPLNRITSDFAPAGDCLVADYATTATGLRPLNGCYFGDLKARRLLVLYGDSNAAMWIDSFDAMGKAQHFKVELVARARCFISNEQYWSWGTLAPDRGCTGFHAWAYRHIASEHPAAVIAVDYEAIAHFSYSDMPIPESQYLRGYSAAIQQLRSSGAIVAVLSQPVYPNSDPTVCLDQNRGDVRTCFLKTKTFLSSYNVSGVKQAVMNSGGTYVVITDLLCARSICPTIVGHIAVFFDHAHISNTYAIFIWRALEDKLIAAGVLSKNSSK